MFIDIKYIWWSIFRIWVNFSIFGYFISYFIWIKKWMMCSLLLLINLFNCLSFKKFWTLGFFKFILWIWFFVFLLIIFYWFLSIHHLFLVFLDFICYICWLEMNWLKIVLLLLDNLIFNFFMQKFIYWIWYSD